MAADDRTVEARLADIQTELMGMAAALHDIAQDAPDADTVRRAVSGLHCSQVGIIYLAQNPLVV